MAPPPSIMDISMLRRSASRASTPPTSWAAERLRQVIEGLRGRFDAILIDSPPILPVSDALVLSSLADRILVVTRLKMLDRSVLHELKRVVGTAPAKPLGFIATERSRIRRIWLWRLRLHTNPSDPRDPTIPS
jgi:Mrp family chromosome partitioning ATPase